MIFAYTNLADSATVTASSEISTMPATSVQNEALHKVWSCSNSLTDEWIKFDMGSAVEINALVVYSHSFGDSFNNMAIQGNATDSWGSPSFDYPVNPGSSYGGPMVLFGEFDTLRWWRIKYTKAASSDTHTIGRIFLGDYTQTTEEPDFDGYEESIQDNSVKQKSRGGQTFVDQRDDYLDFSVKFSDISNANSAIIKTYADAVGEHTSHFVQVQTTAPLNDWRYVKLKKALGRKVSGFSNSSFMWDIKALEYETQL